MTKQELEIANLGTQKISNDSNQTVVLDAIKKMKEFSELPPNFRPTTPAETARLNEMERTIYCGNIGPKITEDHLRAVFGTCGVVQCIRFNNHFSENSLLASFGARYAFVEFDSVSAARKSFALNGLILGDRGLKVAKASNPILKTKAIPQPTILTNPARVVDAMNLVRVAVGRLNDRKKLKALRKKLAKAEKKEDTERSKKRKKGRH